MKLLGLKGEAYERFLLVKTKYIHNSKFKVSHLKISTY